MTLNGVMAVFYCVIPLNLVNLRCRKRSVADFMQDSIVFLVRVHCRRKESSRSLSHLLMSFLLAYTDLNSRYSTAKKLTDSVAAFQIFLLAVFFCFGFSLLGFLYLNKNCLCSSSVRLS